MKIYYQDNYGTLYQGDVLEVLKTLPDESVDTIITSPPYWSLRNYLPENHPNKHKEIGTEPKLDDYIENLLKITAELKRILKKTGVMFWNHGDCYSAKRWTGQGKGQPMNKFKDGYRDINPDRITGLPDKTLVLQNERLIQRMVYEQHWRLRNRVVWYKSNSMPGPWRDRLTNKYEFIYILTKSGHYYFDLDSIREPHKWESIKRLERAISGQNKYMKSGDKKLMQSLNKPRPNINNLPYHPKGDNPSGVRLPPQPNQPNAFNLKGKNPGDIWSNNKYLKDDIKTASPGARAVRSVMQGKLTTFVRKKLYDVGQYLKDKLKASGLNVKRLSEILDVKETTLAHYFRIDLSGQALPDKNLWERMKPILNLGNYDDYIQEEIRNALPQPNPLGANPGDMWQALNEYDEYELKEMLIYLYLMWIKTHPEDFNLDDVWEIATESLSELHFAHFPQALVRKCIKVGCPKDGIALDPFTGSGTTPLVSTKMNRKWIGIELNEKYCQITVKRLKREMGLLLKEKEA